MNDISLKTFILEDSLFSFLSIYLLGATKSSVPESFVQLRVCGLHPCGTI